MKFMGMSAGMWALYKKSFGENLVSVLGFSKSEAAEIPPIFTVMSVCFINL